MNEVVHPDVFWRGTLERMPSGFEDLSDLMHHLPPSFRARHHGHVVARSGSEACEALRGVIARFGEAGLTDGMVRDALLRGHHPERLPAIATFVRYGLLDFSRHTEPAHHLAGFRHLSTLFLFKECSLLHRMAVEAESGHHPHHDADDHLHYHPHIFHHETHHHAHPVPHTSLRARFSALAHAGLSLDLPGHDGVTPLMLAASQGGHAVARALIESGANVDARDHHGATAVHWAARTNHPTTLEMLVMAGGSPDAFDARGWTPLHVAAATGGVESVRTLGLMGAEMNPRDLHGVTPLLLAVRKRRAEVIGALIEVGARPNVAHMPGHFSALHDAARLGYFDEARALIDAGANVNVVDDAGMTPLHMAGHFAGLPVPRRDLAAYLLDHGALLEVRAKSGLRPVDFAGREGSEFVFNLLVARGAQPPHKLYVRNLDP